MQSIAFILAEFALKRFVSAPQGNKTGPVELSSAKLPNINLPTRPNGGGRFIVVTVSI